MFSHFLYYLTKSNLINTARFIQEAFLQPTTGISIYGLDRYLSISSISQYFVPGPVRTVARVVAAVEGTGEEISEGIIHNSVMV